MGKQINFYMDEMTEARFIEFVISTGGTVLFEGDSHKPINVTSLPKVDDWYQLYFYKREFGNLNLKPIDENKYYIDSITSPVIEFSRTYKREIGKNKEISRGRIWVEMKFWNEQGELEEKTKELDKWYGTLNRWIKKNVHRVDEMINGQKYSNYVSPSLKELTDRGYKFM